MELEIEQNFNNMKIDLLHCLEGTENFFRIIIHTNGKIKERYSLDLALTVKDLFIDPEGSQLVLLLFQAEIPNEINLDEEGNVIPLKKKMLILQEDRKNNLKILNEYSPSDFTDLKFYKRTSYPNYSTIEMQFIKNKTIRNLHYMSKRNRFLIDKLIEDYTYDNSFIDEDFFLSLQRKSYSRLTTGSEPTDLKFYLNETNLHYLRRACRNNVAIRNVVDTPLFFKKYLKSTFSLFQKNKTGKEEKQLTLLKENFSIYDISIEKILDERPCKKGVYVSYISYLTMIFDVMKIGRPDDKIKENPGYVDADTLFEKFFEIIDRYKKFYFSNNKLEKKSFLYFLLIIIPTNYSLNLNIILKLIECNNIEIFKYLFSNSNLHEINEFRNGGFSSNAELIDVALLKTDNFELYQLFLQYRYNNSRIGYHNIYMGGINFLRDYVTRDDIFNISFELILRSGNMEIIDFCAKRGLFNNVSIHELYSFAGIVSDELLNYLETEEKIYPNLNKEFIFSSRNRGLSWFKKFIPSVEKEISSEKVFDFSMKIVHREDKFESYFLYDVILFEKRTQFKVNVIKFLNSCNIHHFTLDHVKYFIEDLKLERYFNYFILNILFDQPKIISYILTIPSLKAIIDSVVNGGYYILESRRLDYWHEMDYEFDANIAIRDLMNCYRFDCTS